MDRFLFIILFLSILVSGCISTGTETARVEVTQVTDGDTVTVILGSSEETVRLKGIDTPETYSENQPGDFFGVPDSQNGRECLNSWGWAATGFVESRIENRTVELEYESTLTGKRRGNYGRLLGVIRYENTSLNRELVRKGYARSYTEDGPYIEEERAAKLNMSGVWNCQKLS